MVELVQSSAPAPRSPRLLVIDDQADCRTILSRRFARHGFAVQQAADGREALDQIAAGNVDLVLLDICMPDLDGFEVLARIRQTHDGVVLPVIVVTVRDEPEDVKRAMTLGANDFIAKPIDFEAALARVRCELSRREAAGGATGGRTSGEP